MRKIRLLVSLLFVGLVVVACGVNEPAPEAKQPRERVPPTPVTLSISPDGLKDGEVGKEYEFTFSASNIPSGARYVTFKWSLGDGKATGNKKVEVVDGTASTKVTHAYSDPNVYGLTAAVVRVTGIRLAEKSVSVAVGVRAEDRERELGSCDGWRSSTEGGYGVTVDVWDISTVPVGAVFDLKFDTYQIPDKIVIQSSDGVELFNSGWRGAKAYDGMPLYPGGLAGTGKGGAEAVFNKADATTFKVTVIGPDPKTKWKYEVQCRVLEE